MAESKAKKKKVAADDGAAPKAKRAAKPKAPKLTNAPAAADLALGADDAALAALADAVRAAGGAVLGAWRDPLGGTPLLLVSLPVDQVAPTTFQRDVSPAHVKKLANAIGKTGRFLDPIIVMREADGRFLTPNGHHRLTAMRELGASSITGVLVPERSVAYQILALNVEKAHNLRERATEVRRMLVDLATWAAGGERDFELELEEPSLVTVGFAYEARPRFSGGAYASVLKKVDAWVEGSLADAVKERQRRAAEVLVLDDAVEEAVQKLKAQGLTSPYLRAFVVSRVNPLRFLKGDPPPMDELLASMTEKAKKLDAGKVKATDLASSGGAPDED